jgi:hypothetical protein
MWLFLLYRDATTHVGLWLPHYGVFTITFRHNTLGGTPLEEGSARSRDLYLITHNTHYMPPAGFEPTILASELPQTYLCLRPCGHWDRESCDIQGKKHVCL